MFIVSVVGASLKKVLDGGVREKMNKAMMFLVQKSAVGAVDDRREGSSKPRHSVSLKLLDDHGGVVPNDAEVAFEKDVSTGVGEKMDRRWPSERGFEPTMVPPGLCLTRLSLLAIVV